MPTERAYLDHAATTPLRDEVREAMLPWLAGGGNPSSPHAEGRRARAALDDARRRVGRAIGARPREIVFVSGGTEADALAVAGAGRAGPRRIAASAIEHRAVLAAVDAAVARGDAAERLAVDGAGRVGVDAVEAALERGAGVVSVMLANNEIGTVQPIARFAALTRRRALLHVDAVQAPGRLPLDVDALGVDLLALAAHKCYGPVGIGALYVREGTPLRPVQPGGGQELGRRGGTENVAAAVGFALALELATAERAAEAPRLTAMRDRFEAALLAAAPGARVVARDAERLPSVSAIWFPGIDAPLLAIALDLAGLAVSTGSACATGAAEPSHVLAALGDSALARDGAVRFSFGHAQRLEDVERLAAVVARTVATVGDDGAGSGTGDPRPSPTVDSEVVAWLGRPQIRPELAPGQ